MLISQLCPTLYNPVDYNLPCASVQGILHARILEWIAIPFSRGSSWPWDWTRSPALKADSLLSEPWEKPHNVGGPHSISWKIYRTKTPLFLPWERENSASQVPLDSNYNSSLSLQPASLPHRIHTHKHPLLVLFIWRTLTKYKYLGNFFMRMNLRTSPPWKKSYDQPR